MRRECRERFPRHRLQRKPLVSDPDMHHGTCVTHVPWCMSGSPTCDGGGKRSRHSDHMRNPQFYVSGRGPWRLRHLVLMITLSVVIDHIAHRRYHCGMWAGHRVHVCFRLTLDNSLSLWAGIQYIDQSLRHSPGSNPGPIKGRLLASFRKNENHCWLIIGEVLCHLSN